MISPGNLRVKIAFRPFFKDISLHVKKHQEKKRKEKRVHALAFYIAILPRLLLFTTKERGHKQLIASKERGDVWDISLC